MSPTKFGYLKQNAKPRECQISDSRICHLSSSKATFVEEISGEKKMLKQLLSPIDFDCVSMQFFFIMVVSYYQDHRHRSDSHYKFFDVVDMMQVNGAALPAPVSPGLPVKSICTCSIGRASSGLFRSTLAGQNILCRLFGLVGAATEKPSCFDTA